jgi:hypothetical protein
VEQSRTADAWEKEHQNIKKEKPVDTHDGDVEVTVEHEHNSIMEQEEESVLQETAADEWEKEHQKDTDDNNDNKDKDVKFAYGPNGELDKVMAVSEYLDESEQDQEPLEDVEKEEELLEMDMEEEAAPPEPTKEYDVEFAYGPDGALDKVVDVDVDESEQQEQVPHEMSLYVDVDGPYQKETQTTAPPGNVNVDGDVVVDYVDGDEAEEVAETVVSDVKGLYQETETQSTAPMDEQEGSEGDDIEGSQEENNVNVDGDVVVDYVDGDEAEEEIPVVVLDGKGNDDVDIDSSSNDKNILTTSEQEEQLDLLEKEEDVKPQMTKWDEDEFIQDMALDEQEQEEEWEQEYINLSSNSNENEEQLEQSEQTEWEQEAQEEWEQASAQSYYDYDLHNGSSNEYDMDDADYNTPALDEYGFPIGDTTKDEETQFSQDWNNNDPINQESENEVPGNAVNAAPYGYNNFNHDGLPTEMEKAEAETHVVDGKIVGTGSMNMNRGSMVLLVAIVGVLLSLMLFVRSRRDRNGEGNTGPSSTLPQRRSNSAAGGGAGSAAAGYEPVNPGQTYNFGNKKH